jgi:probable addiction module antidote protein
MDKQRTYRTNAEADEAYFREHPEEVDAYLAVAFEEYAHDSCTAALLSQLRIIARVKGISLIANETGITRKGVQKALSEEGNPRFESINAILHAMGYQLVPQRMATI